MIWRAVQLPVPPDDGPRGRRPRSSACPEFDAGSPAVRSRTARGLQRQGRPAAQVRVRRPPARRRCRRARVGRRRGAGRRSRPATTVRPCRRCQMSAPSRQPCGRLTVFVTAGARIRRALKPHETGDPRMAEHHPRATAVDRDRTTSACAVVMDAAGPVADDNVARRFRQVRSMTCLWPVAMANVRCLAWPWRSGGMQRGSTPIAGPLANRRPRSRHPRCPVAHPGSDRGGAITAPTHARCCVLSTHRRAVGDPVRVPHGLVADLPVRPVPACLPALRAR